VALRVGVES